MRILFLSRWFPYPPSNGSKLRVYNLMRGLAKHHEVSLLTFADQPNVQVDSPELLAICDRVQVVPLKPFAPESLRARIGIFGREPRSVTDTFSAEMAQCIEETLSNDKYDLVTASQIMMAGYSRYFAHVPSIFEEIEVGVIYEQYIAPQATWRRLRYGLTWLKHRRYLVNLMRQFEACTVVSEPERQLLRERVCADHRLVEVIPNCVNVDDYGDVQVEPQPNTLIFSGSFTYAANYQAMKWFVSQVYPAIQAEFPEVRLIITGDHAGLPLPSTRNIELTGFVDDVVSCIASATISLAPLWVGGGTRLKILEAMALHTPVVATSKGAEGLDVCHGEHLMIADTPDDFAGAVVHLLRNPGMQRQLARNAYQLVRAKYDWNAVMPQFLALVERVARG